MCNHVKHLGEIDEKRLQRKKCDRRQRGKECPWFYWKEVQPFIDNHKKF
jgi:hypothetical protein